jgi:hypothetical protein
MMFSVHGAEEIRGGFVAGLFLPGAPFHKQAVADSPKQAHQAHGFGKAHAAQVVPVRDVQALVQAAFDAPSRPIVYQPLCGVKLGGRQTRHQGYNFG